METKRLIKHAAIVGVVVGAGTAYLMSLTDLIPPTWALGKVKLGMVLLIGLLAAGATYVEDKWF